MEENTLGEQEGTEYVENTPGEDAADEPTEGEGGEGGEGKKAQNHESLWGFINCGNARFLQVKQYCRDIGRPMREVVNERLVDGFNALFAEVDATQEERDGNREKARKAGKISGDTQKLAAEAERLEARLALLRERLGTATPEETESVNECEPEPTEVEPEEPTVDAGVIVGTGVTIYTGGSDTDEDEDAEEPVEEPTPSRRRR